MPPKKTFSNLKETVRIYWHHMRPHPLYLAGAFGLLPAIVLVQDILLPIILSNTLARLAQDAVDKTIVFEDYLGAITLFGLLQVLVFVVLWRAQVYALWKLDLIVQKNMANYVFNHLLEQSISFHSNRFGGSIVSQTNKFLGAYIRFVDTLTFNLIPLILMILFSLVTLVLRAPIIAAAFALFSIAYVIVATITARTMQEKNTFEAQAQTKQTGQLADSITNINAVKTFAHEKAERSLFENVTERTRQAGVIVMRGQMRRDVYFSTINSLTIISALVMAVILASHDTQQIATAILAVTLAGNLSRRLWDFNSVLRNFNRIIGDAYDMTQILTLKHDVRDKVSPEKCRISAGNVKFDKVTFAYPEQNGRVALFENFSLDIASGERIGLVGPSGGGKTTVTKLILRLMDVNNGSILIDGQNISRVSQRDLRKNITYVPQEPLLFHRTLMENIRYGQPDATDEEVKEAAKLAHAHEFIKELSAGYETLVGERGVKLSGGQRQRVAIARAMLKKAPIVILDEATSALDSESEKLIQDALWKLMEGRTAIVIAHRLSTIQRMDRIIVLKDGEIAESGSHKHLLKKKGIYADLWTHQSGGFIED